MNYHFQLTRSLPSLILAAMLVAVVCLSPNRAARADDSGTPKQNAALALRPLFARYRALEKQMGYPEVTSLYGSGTPQEVEAARAFMLGPARLIVGELVEATRIEQCDWETDLTKGPFALLAHVGDTRAGARLLCTDARLRLEGNEPAVAAEDYAALFRLARHTRGTDPFLISALVEASIAALACTETQRALDRGLFDRAQKQLLLQTIQGFDPNNPHRIRESIASEEEMLVDWLRRTYELGRPATESMRELAELLGMNDPRARTRFLGIVERGESIEPYLILLKGAFDAAVTAWDAPNARQALQDLYEEVQAGKYGPLASFAVADFSSSRATHDKSVADLANLRLRLAE